MSATEMKDYDELILERFRMAGGAERWVTKEEACSAILRGQPKKLYQSVSRLVDKNRLRRMVGAPDGKFRYWVITQGKGEPPKTRSREAHLALAQRLIAAECDAIKAMLLDKNKKYGNSALDPVRIFSKASPDEQILTRLDDKISRLTHGESADEDVMLDLVGYAILYRVQKKFEKQKGGST